MKEALLKVLLVILLLAITGCAQGQNSSPQKLKGVYERQAFMEVEILDKNSNTYKDDLAYITNALAKLYPFSERKDLDLAKLGQRYMLELQLVDTDSQYEKLLLQLFAELSNSHTKVAHVSKGEAVKCELIEDQVVVTAIQQEARQAMQGDVQVGWRIVEVDDVPVKQWLKDRYQYISSSTEQGLLHESVRRLFHRFTFDYYQRKFTLVDSGGKEHILTAELNRPWMLIQQWLHQEENVVVEKKAEIGYIRVNSMLPGTEQEFAKALQEVAAVKGLILDIRYNRGGSVKVANKMLSHLLETESAGWFFEVGGERITPHPEINYPGPIVLLTGPHTFSAAEGFAWDLQDLGRALVVGAPTQGDCGGSTKTYLTKYGTTFTIPVTGVYSSLSGVEMEGQGLEPEILCSQSLADYYNEVDTVLQRGIQEVKTLMK